MKLQCCLFLRGLLKHKMNVASQGQIKSSVQLHDMESIMGRQIGAEAILVYKMADEL